MTVTERPLGPPPAPLPHRPPRAPRGTIRRHARRGEAVASPERRQLLDFLRRFGPIAAVLVAYVLAAFVVPTMTPALVGDDWVYVRAVEHLLLEGRLVVLDLAVVTLVFQALWGALFAALFGLSFGVLRISTVAVTMLGAVAVYGLCRELGVRRGWSALGAAAFLFNPLAYVLSFTFMTDPHFTAWLMVATWVHARALRPDRPSVRLLWVASALSAVAFLVRQQGALIPPAALLALFFAGRLRLNREGLRTVLRVALVPAAAMVLYYAWIFFVRGVPGQQEAFTQKIVGAGVDGTAVLVGRMTFIEAMYLGVLALPVIVMALGAAPRLWRGVPRLGWAIVAGWAAMLGLGFLHFTTRGPGAPPMPRMPYIAQYVGTAGLGPTDLLGGRPALVGAGALDLITGLCALGSLVYVLLLVRALPAPPRPDPTRFVAGLVLAIAGGQVLGILPPSFHFRNWIISVDRYLLPLLPLALCLGLWALRGLRARPDGAWVVVAAFALFAIAGTRDYLVYQGAIWDLARYATQVGVPLTKLDAGAAWDGYYLYEYSIANGIKTQTKGGPWWTDLFGPATDSTYVVASGPLPGYDAVAKLPYSSWLHGDQTMSLLRRQDYPGPP